MTLQLQQEKILEKQELPKTEKSKLDRCLDMLLGNVRFSKRFAKDFCRNRIILPKNIDNLWEPQNTSKRHFYYTINKMLEVGKGGGLGGFIGYLSLLMLVKNNSNVCTYIVSVDDTTLYEINSNDYGIEITLSKNLKEIEHISIPHNMPKQLADCSKRFQETATQAVPALPSRTHL